uniref:Ycf55 n=1 Tax=Chondria sp. (in: red algae) TaxID=1982705 RepID=A0A1Z1ME03_9FLOR|nr:hypothetical protein [Chondria sp. (in: red algae)]
MIRYWPTQPSIKLNNVIVELFTTTESKLKKNLPNRTNHYLYIDILNSQNKRKLLKLILDEFKNLLLDLIELNLSTTQINKLDQKILIILIKKVSKTFQFNKYLVDYRKIILLDKNQLYLIKELITYLIFGSSSIQYKSFLFNSLHTPYNHVQILFENFVIDTANTVVKNTIDDLKNSTSIYNFFKETNKCNYLYTSQRSITLFLNNLKWQNLIESWIYETKSLYNEREKVLVMSSKGIITKYIYLSNVHKIKYLNKIQVTFLLWLEFRDLTIPKIEKVILQVSKYLAYFFVNFFSNLGIGLLRLFIFYLNK